MSSVNLEIGDLVVIKKGDRVGKVGIISNPITDQKLGHVLVHEGGSIIGMNVSFEDVDLAGETSEGFAQLGYHLIKLGSLMIE